MTDVFFTNKLKDLTFQEFAQSNIYPNEGYQEVKNIICNNEEYRSILLRFGIEGYDAELDAFEASHPDLIQMGDNMELAICGPENPEDQACLSCSEAIFVALYGDCFPESSLEL